MRFFILRYNQIMKTVLLDATALPQQPVGAGVYITNLVRELLQGDYDLHFKVLAHADDFSLFQLSQDEAHNFIFLKDYGRGWRIGSEQILYPILYKRIHADLFHGLHYSFPLNKAIRAVSTIHDLSFLTHPQKHNLIKRYYFPFFINQARKKADHIFVVSENTRSDLIKFLPATKQIISVTPLGVEPQFFDIFSDDRKKRVQEKYRLPAQFLLFVGLIEPRKNVPLLIDAYLNLLKTEHLNFDLVVAGRWGWERKDLLSHYEQEENFARVHFPGYIEREDLPVVFQLASIFVYPSVYEGFGLPVLEAMASRLPVITSNVSAMPDLVGECGWLVPPNHQSALENAILGVMKNPDLARERSTAARARAETYTWKNTADKTVEVYKRLLVTKKS